MCGASQVTCPGTAHPIGGGWESHIVQGKAPQDDGPQEYQTIPIDKIGDFGMHVKQYVLVVRPLTLERTGKWFNARKCALSFASPGERGNHTRSLALK